MADLNARIKPKKSSTAGEVPQAADLEVAEIAVNTADGKLFVKHTDNSIKEISGTGGGGGGIEEAPEDGTPYARQDAGWVSVPAGSGAVDSVNGQTGVVSLGTDDLTDVSGTAPVTLTFTQYNSNPTLDSDFRWNSTADFFYYINGGRS